MKINKENKKRTLIALKGLTRILQVDYVMHKQINPDEFANKRDCWWFADFHNTLDIIYLLMVGEKETDIYDKFQSPANIGQEPKKPVGWYKTQYNQGENYLEGPEEYQGFICDRINDTILDRKLDALYKYNLLHRFFSDLIKIEKKFKKRNKKK